MKSKSQKARKPHNILMISSEAIPWAKSGGLADVLPSLAKELAAQGLEVRIVLPRYYFVDRSSLTRLPVELSVPFMGEDCSAQLYEATSVGAGVRVWFVDYEPYFGRDGLYGDKVTREYPDNAERFSFLNHAVFSIIRAGLFAPDIIHAHDWQAAPSLAFLKNGLVPGLETRCAGVFTLHNVGYQGLFPAEKFEVLGLPPEEFGFGHFEFWGRCNFMQGGMRHADRITTVSPTYAKEICTPDFGFGLDGILRERAADVGGILNGMDTELWNPETDPAIAENYTAATIERKAVNKAAVQKEFGLAERGDLPLFAIISRMTSQKGFEILLDPETGCLGKMLASGTFQLVVLGSGDKIYEDELRRLGNEYSNLGLRMGYSENLSHLMQAGADFFLMPSLYEPCGLTQMYALRYGTVPVVAATGGLVDSVIDLDKDPASASGIHIELPVSPVTIDAALARALGLWADPKALKHVRLTGMKAEFSWTVAAREYLRVFDEALASVTGA